MSTFTLDTLRRIMRDCVGDPEAAPLGDAIEDVEFADLGYDSLAMLEIAAKIGQATGITLPEEAVEEMTTPARAVGYVNECLGGVPA
ncbi:acyl carrier protein [Amycolatopsis sp. NPDC021455]|uniref:acyl carrier protein n=1 Tax=Amycolatopsis sp. NPDC021455 TaxID=3154901 RepID=UPI0033FD0703